MRNKSNNHIELLLYTIGVISTFFLFYLSHKLATPILVDLKLSGTFTDLLLNSEVHVGYGWHLFLPMVLMLTGVMILVVLLWRMGKSIIHQRDTAINKILMALLAALLMTILVKAFLNGWGLIILNFKYIILSIVLVVIFLTTLSQVQRQRDYE
ncbi:hypothetical protein [Lysinibacillus antri]|uniref:Uncharacterized protein n=1 Tax=Lysinibacillus antri TaxID=2498145 RepID=A0A3S0RH77_9BACI|nr:hypothetical protein [Lysinibacillus antri]RUL48184.1 hypothetical protein EK386_17230 [Lysinibacillus antri]